MKHTRKNKPDRKVKKNCPNHCGCGVCDGNRLHKFVKPELESIDDLVNAIKELGLDLPLPQRKDPIPECNKWYPY